MQTPESSFQKSFTKNVLNVETSVGIVNITMLTKFKDKKCNNKTNICIETINVKIIYVIYVKKVKLIIGVSIIFWNMKKLVKKTF